MKDRVKRFFDLRLYTKEQVKMFTIKGVLTRDDYEEITGELWGVTNDERY